MAQEGQTEALYDFLYRDSSRLASYYAQIFSGKLTTIEATQTARDLTTKSGKMGLGFAGGEMSGAKESLETARHISDPHDLLTTDVLNSLKASGRILETGAREAPHGSIVLIKGAIRFADGQVMASAIPIIQASAASLDHDTTEAINAVCALMGTIRLPSMFVLYEERDGLAAGIVKDQGLEDGVAAFQAKHGGSPLPDVYIIGIKEVPQASFDGQLSAFLQASMQLGTAVSDLLFPPGALRITPLVIFRKL